LLLVAAVVSARALPAQDMIDRLALSVGGGVHIPTRGAWRDIADPMVAVGGTVRLYHRNRHALAARLMVAPAVETSRSTFVEENPGIPGRINETTISDVGHVHLTLDNLWFPVDRRVMPVVALGGGLHYYSYAERVRRTFLPRQGLMGYKQSTTEDRISSNQFGITVGGGCEVLLDRLNRVHLLLRYHHAWASSPEVAQRTVTLEAGWIVFLN